jgi:two-component system CheB/CheR fusion protein
VPAGMASDQTVFEKILERVREVRNCDFRLYKKATLRRRIDRRMAERKCSTLQSYLSLLEKEPDEINTLVAMMLIKVSSFFRDREPWDVLRSKILPQIIANKSPADELRIWCAGCATGEEAYSVAMLCAEVLGSAFNTYPVKVFATDIDQAAVNTARRGFYSAESVKGIDEAIRNRWFSKTAEGVTVHKELRRVVVFGINDLVSDAPISRLDLLICRNVFIYLDPALQKRVLSRFHYALRPEGLLMLGKSELIPFAAKIFQPMDLQRRIYRKDRRGDIVTAAWDRLNGLLERQELPADEPLVKSSLVSQFHRDIVHSLTVPVIGTALDGTVMLWNNACARLWGRSESDVVGKKLVSLLLPGLGGDLLVDKTTLIRQGRSERESSAGVVSRGPGYAEVSIVAEVSALRAGGGSDDHYGYLYRIADVSSLRTIESELVRSNEERQSAVEELQTTNEELQSANEELETTNEELQSANEELQTTNEELQSTNEELETTNEELQSTNAELDATNRELGQRTEELNLMGFYQRTLIRSLSAAVVVLDRTGRITIWNLAAERLLGLPETETIGQLIWSLRIPALQRSQLVRIRRSLDQKLALRIDNLMYDLPPRGHGFGNLAAVPIVELDQYLGAVLLFEDGTKQALLARELKELKSQVARANGGKVPKVATKPATKITVRGKPASPSIGRKTQSARDGGVK